MIHKDHPFQPGRFSDSMGLTGQLQWKQTVCGLQTELDLLCFSLLTDLCGFVVISVEQSYST